MQSKISAFFKPSSSSSSTLPRPADPPPASNGSSDDELTIWENKQHQHYNTYKRRAPNPQRSGSDNDSVNELPVRPNSDTNSRKPELGTLGKTVIKNKKRSYAQFYLDFGQSDFNLHTCSICGVKYTPGDEEDEKAHKAFHKDYTRGIQFKGWCNERVILAPSVEGRALLVLDCDPPAQRNKVDEVVKRMESELGSGWILHKLCKVYLFILSHRIVGCLVAEPIKEAHKVRSIAVDRSSDATTKNEAKLTTFQFGDVRFQTEVMRKAPPSAPEALNENLNGAIFCEKEAVSAVCGIRAIWVTPANRRKRIATQLLDALRKSFCTGFVLERCQLAFSQPTSAGTALASSFSGGEYFLVYTANNMVP